MAYAVVAGFEHNPLITRIKKEIRENPPKKRIIKIGISDNFRRKEKED